MTRRSEEILEEGLAFSVGREIEPTQSGIAVVRPICSVLHQNLLRIGKQPGGTSLCTCPGSRSTRATVMTPVMRNLNSQSA